MFQCKFSQFLNFKNIESLNLCATQVVRGENGKCHNFIIYSCIDIYAHSCLKPFSICRKLCSNSKTHVQIMKFTCRLNMGFGRRHWSVRRDVMCFVETKWPTLKKLRGFR